jgi:hypothetical protein
MLPEVPSSKLSNRPLLLASVPVLKVEVLLLETKVFDDSTLSLQPSPSESKSKTFGMPSPSVSVSKLQS